MQHHTLSEKGFLFWLQLVITLLCCAFLAIPILQSVLAGFTVNYFQGLQSGLTFRWLLEMWDLYAQTIYRSLLIAFLCLFCCVLIGVPAAYFMVRRTSRLMRILEELLVLPLAIPGLAIALAILVSYGGIGWFRKSIACILAGHVLFTLPFMVRSVIAVLGMLDLKELEESAASLGAGFWQRLWQVVLPNAWPGIISGSLMVFTLSIGEFNLTWMLHTPLTMTLPVGLADSYASMRLEIGSAYTIAFFIMIIPVLVVLQHLGKPKNRGKSAPKDSLAREMPMSNFSVEHLGNGVSIRLTGCGKTFADGTRALDPLNLTIEPGHTVVLLGPSGCGKTTTLRLIAGLEHPDKGGTIHFDDQDVTRLPIEKRNVGMVFQNYALFTHMTVQQNVAYGLKIQKISKSERERRSAAMLEMMRIGNLAERQVDQLSGGQRQRVALARALAVRPRVLLLDEPLTALDAKLRETLRDEINGLLKKLGITSIYVTHDQSEAMALGDTVVVMDHGRIVQAGSPRDIYFQPKDRFVADFIGAFSKLECVRKKDWVTVAGIPLADVGELKGVVNGSPSFAVFFRPENASIDYNGLLPAVVESTVFLGDRLRVRARLSDGQAFQVDAPGNRYFQPGQEISITIDPSLLMVL